MTSILNVGRSALAAAQVGITTTGHNIANVNTPGYSRQVVVQTNMGGNDSGFGFIGAGTDVSAISRVFDEYLAGRVLTTQSSYHYLDTYHSQISLVNNMFADQTTGISPALQEFFKGVQNVGTDPSSGPARQSMLSSASTLASQFRNLDTQLRDATSGVNTQISSSIETINNYAQQLAQLNDSIEKATAGDLSKSPNDLLDQRDQIVSDLSKQINVSVVKQGASYNVVVGTGQPLVVGANAFSLGAVASPTDPTRMEVAYISNGKTIALPESAITGGTLGGLFDYRAQTLDTARNSIGRMAIALATTVNDQHKLGQDLNGALGKDFFAYGAPLVTGSSVNTGTATISATIVNANALTTSDYSLLRDNTGNYQLKRKSDGKILSNTTFAAARTAAQAEGFDFSISNAGAIANNDEFLIRPTANGAQGFSVLISNPSEIAAAAPVKSLSGTLNAVTGAITNSNKGTGALGQPVVSSVDLMPNGLALTYDGTNLTGIPSQYPVTITNGLGTTTYAAGATIPYTPGDVVSFNGISFRNVPTVVGTATLGPVGSALTYSTGNLTGFPAGLDVTLTPPNGGTPVTYAAGTPVPWTDGATLSYGGISYTMGGTPAEGDVFTVAKNSGGVGDKRNMLLLGALQSAKTIGNGAVSYQGSLAQLVNMVGNKAHELDVTASAQEKMMTQAQEAVQSTSGVNLDEEAANLLRYQQAYEAAGKVMSTASRLFDVLLQISQ